MTDEQFVQVKRLGEVVFRRTKFKESA